MQPDEIPLSWAFLGTMQKRVSSDPLVHRTQIWVRVVSGEGRRAPRGSRGVS